MAEQVRRHDWSENALGPVAGWSETLLSQVNLLLHLPYPANLGWGESLILFYNDAAIESVGARHGTALGESSREFLRGVWDQIGADFEACLSAGTATVRESVFVPPRGDEELGGRYWNYCMTPVYEGFSVGGVLQIFQDTTESVLRRLRLARERADLAALFEQAPVAMTLLEGPEHIFTMANRAYEGMLGKRRYVGQRARDVLPEAEEQGFINLLDEVYRTGEPYSANNARLTLRRVPGGTPEDVFLDFICSPRRDVNGQVCGIVTMAIDVTDRRHVMQALVESEKVAAVGRLASSIAHEINNPLASAINYLYLAETAENMAEVREYLAVVDRELKRVAAISSQTLLSQKQAMTLSSITFEDLAVSTLIFYKGVIQNARILVETRFRSQEALRCVEGQLRQVVINLISNAIDAMPLDGGRLLIRACEGCDWKSGRKVHKLTIADTGGGIPEETLREIFKPFFTTKGFGGNGLGLWVCQEIVERHQGRIAARSRAGRGSVFTLYLPQQGA